MSDVQFSPIWEIVIYPIIKQQCEDDHRVYYNKKVSRFLIEHYFNKYRDEFIASFMEYKNKNIDRHKIAACLVKAILVAKPIKIKPSFFITSFFSKKRIDERVRLHNESLSISTAISILESYIFSDDERRFKHRIFLPLPFPEKDNEYERDLYIALYHIGGRKFEPIIFANLLFLLEKYSCRRIQCDNLEDFCRSLLTGEHAYCIEKANEIIDSAKYDHIVNLEIATKEE